MHDDARVAHALQPFVVAAQTAEDAVRPQVDPLIAERRRHHSRYSSSQTRFSRLTTFADSPRAASAPTKAATA